MDKSVQLSAAPVGLHGRVFSASHIPERSGFPSAVLGAGAPRFGVPAGVLGIPAVGYFIHCAASGAQIAIATLKTTNTTTTMRFIILTPGLLPDHVRHIFFVFQANVFQQLFI